MCTGASLGGGLSPPAVRILPGQIRSPQRRRKRVPNRGCKSRRRRRRRRVPNRTHKNGKAPGERVFCRERALEGFGSLHRSCAPAAAPLTLEKRHRRNRRVTISIGPPLECGCVGECKSSQGAQCHSSFAACRRASWPYSTGTERAAASSNRRGARAHVRTDCGNRL